MRKETGNKQYLKFGFCLLLSACLLISNYAFDWLVTFHNPSTTEQIVSALYIGAGGVVLANIVYRIAKTIHKNTQFK